MKRVRCPKCDNYIVFDETRYQPGQQLVFVCPDPGCFVLGHRRGHRLVHDGAGAVCESRRGLCGRVQAGGGAADPRKPRKNQKFSCFRDRGDRAGRAERTAPTGLRVHRRQPRQSRGDRRRVRAEKSKGAHGHHGNRTGNAGAGTAGDGGILRGFHHLREHFARKNRGELPYDDREQSGLGDRRTA